MQLKYLPTMHKTLGSICNTAKKIITVRYYKCFSLRTRNKQAELAPERVVP